MISECTSALKHVVATKAKRKKAARSPDMASKKGCDKLALWRLVGQCRCKRASMVLT